MTVCWSLCVYLIAGCRNLSKVITYLLARSFVILKTCLRTFNTTNISHTQFCVVVLKMPTKARSHITFLVLGTNANRITNAATYHIKTCLEFSLYLHEVPRFVCCHFYRQWTDEPLCLLHPSVVSISYYCKCMSWQCHNFCLHCSLSSCYIIRFSF